MNIDIGQIVKERRKQLGITQKHLAELAEVNYNTVYKIETGQVSPTIELLQKLTAVLGMELKLEVKKISEQ
jgi:transcriptional regulator with XRE-family HTH domain